MSHINIINHNNNCLLICHNYCIALCSKNSTKKNYINLCVGGFVGCAHDINNLIIESICAKNKNRTFIARNAQGLIFVDL